MLASRRILVATIVVVIAAATAIAVIPCAMRASVPSKDTSSFPAPKAVVDQKTCDIGTIESAKDFRCSFSVANAGHADLTLAIGNGLCKCLTVELPEQPVAPGDSARIRVTPSKTEETETIASGVFTRDIHLVTNDPERPRLTLTINATVRPRLAVTPSPITLSVKAAGLAATATDFGNALPFDASVGKSRIAECIVYSQRWKSFDVSVAKTSRTGMDCHIEPAPAEALKNLDATGGYRVTVTMPEAMPDGSFADWVDFVGKSTEKGSSDNEQARYECRVDIKGYVRGRLVFHGPKLVNENTLRLGEIQQGESVRERLLVKVNDAQRNLSVTAIEANPAFLKTRWAAYPNASENNGLYRLEVEVPADAPSGDHHGLIRLKTNHPRLPFIEANVDFVVVGEHKPASIAKLGAAGKASH
jgi:hypothetical protein